MSSSANSIDDGRRRVALALHALGDADRVWLLAQLPSAEADAVAGLLAELQQLGIPPDPALARLALAAAGDDGSADALAQALADAPAVLRTRCLAALGAALREQVARQLAVPVPDAAEVERLDAAPALRQAIEQAWRRAAQAGGHA